MKLDWDSITLNGRSYRPEDIAKKIVEYVFNKSIEQLERNFEDTNFNSIVVGVPAKFKAPHHNIIKKIVADATNIKNVTLLPEPIAAALAYYNKKKSTSSNVAIFDMGCGTFDTAFLKPNIHPTASEPYPYIVSEQDGSELAGLKIDEIIEELLLNKLRRNPGTLTVKYYEDNSHVERRCLQKVASEFKECLSRMETYSTRINAITYDGSSVISLERSELETAISPVIDQNIKIMEDMLARAGINKSLSFDILVTGGCSYIPLIKKKLCDAFPLSINRIFQGLPEQSVALGCAIYGATKVIAPKMVFGYGVDTKIPNKKGKYIKIHIPSNIQLPYSKTIVYRTIHDLQDEMKFRIFEVPNAESEACIPLKDNLVESYIVKHHFSSPVLKGTVVDLSIQLEEDGVLIVESNDHGISYPQITHLGFQNKEANVYYE